MNLTWKIYIVIILLFARGAFRVISLGSSMGICHLNLSVVNCLLTYPADAREIRPDPLLTLANLGLVFWPGTRISFALSLFSASWLGISANFPPTSCCQSLGESLLRLCHGENNDNKKEKMNERILICFGFVFVSIFWFFDFRFWFG